MKRRMGDITAKASPLPQYDDDYKELQDGEDHTEPMAALFETPDKLPRSSLLMMTMMMSLDVVIETG